MVRPAPRLTPGSVFPHRHRQGDTRDRPSRLRPKYRVQHSSRSGRAMPPHTITPAQLARLVGLPDARHYRRADRRRSRRGSPDAARRGPPRTSAGDDLGLPSAGTPWSSASGARSSARAWPPGCGMRASRPSPLRAGSRPGSRRAALVRPDQVPPATAGPHGLGHARAPQGGPHRLPLADPALRRPGGRVPLRRPARGRGCGRPLRRDALRHRRTCSGAIAASSARSTS